MIHIAGGTYFEKCSFPEWFEVYGSGGRAATAISQFGAGITLHTYVAKEVGDTLAMLADAHNFAVVRHEATHPVSFTYLHGLADPVIHPHPSQMTKHPAFEVHGEIVIRFGMLEGDAVVRGTRVVYDPQSPNNPRPFRENGSEADELAIVLNYGEAAILTGENEVERQAARLQAMDGANIVIIKQGSRGAFVWTPAGSHYVAPYKTPTVWPLGSGDVFVAAFGYFWGSQKFDPIEAAKLASRSTAVYCNSKHLPLPSKGELEIVPFEEFQVDLDKLQNPPMVYLAGPFFTIPQRWFIEESRRALWSQKLNVFSPYHDVGIGPAHLVVPRDIQGIEESALIFAVADGLDSGTIFEVGHARAKGKPAVVYAQNETPASLKMLEGTGCIVKHDFVSAVYWAAWTALAK